MFFSPTTSTALEEDGWRYLDALWQGPIPVAPPPLPPIVVQDFALLYPPALPPDVRSRNPDLERKYPVEKPLLARTIPFFHGEPPFVLV